ncbi:tetratricopeptide repeat protein [Geitlerinema sp. P-1104]|nr:tetratricopeptide repeat protein [Geitlerinema sp. P-1104]
MIMYEINLPMKTVLRSLTLAVAIALVGGTEGAIASKFFEAGGLRGIPQIPNSAGFSQNNYQLEELEDLCSNADPLTALDACSEAIQRQNCHQKEILDPQLFPKCAILFDNLGAVLEQTGRYEDALTALNYAAELQPGDANIWYNLGIVYVHLQRYEQALEAFDKASDLDPSDTQAQKQADLLRELLEPSLY